MNVPAPVTILIVLIPSWMRLGILLSQSLIDRVLDRVFLGHGRL